MRGRTAFLFFNVLVVLLSLLTGLRVAPGPDILGIVLAFYVLFVLPGFVLCRILGGSFTGNIDVLCFTFLAGLAFASVLVTVGFIPGVTLTTIMSIGAAVDIVLLLFEHRLSAYRNKHSFLELLGLSLPARRGDRRRRVAVAVLVLLIFIGCFVLFYENGNLSVQADSLDHLSFIRRSIDSGRIFPGDSFYRNGDGAAFDPRKGLWHPVLSLWAYQADAPPEFLWIVLPSFLVAIALAAFYYFARRLLGSDAYALLSLVCLLLFFRGEGIRWFTKLGFSRNVAQILLWLGAGSLIRYCTAGGRRYLGATVLTALIGASVHLVYALWIGVILLAICIYVLCIERTHLLRRRFWLCAVLQAAALAVPVVVRAAFTVAPFNEIHTHRQGMLVLSGGLAVVDPVEILSRFGMVFFVALVLFPFLFLLQRGSRARNMTAILFIVPVALVLDPVTAPWLEGRLGYLHYRLLYAAPLMSMLALLLAGLGRAVFAPRRLRPHRAGRMYGVQGERRRGESPSATGTSSRASSQSQRLRSIGINIAQRSVAGIVLALIIWFPGLYSIHAMKNYLHTIVYRDVEIDRPYISLFEYVGDAIPDHSVLVSDPRTSYILSAFTDHFVVVTLDQHCSPTDTAAVRRLEGVRDLFSPAVPLSHSMQFLYEREADYILFNTNSLERSRFFCITEPGEYDLVLSKFRSCPAVLRPIHSADGFYLFEVARDSLVTASRNSCVERYADPLVCEESAESPGEVPETVSGDTRRRDEGGEGKWSERFEEGETTGGHRFVVGRLLDADGCIELESLTIEDRAPRPGSVLRGFFCWRVRRTVAFWFPLEWTMRLDTSYPKGSFYRRWYGKQYRRGIEAEHDIKYRHTRSGPLRSGYVLPEQWVPGELVRQDFEIPLPDTMARGRYTIRVTVRRPAFLENRIIGDYLLDEDSFHGELVAEIQLRNEG
ncbi:MAG: hypothetical protein JSV33_02610 [bacterium]|nr:MAG: hypothetical protein JSV33_02610 [bacterium]